MAVGALVCASVGATLSACGSDAPVDRAQPSASAPTTPPITQSTVPPTVPASRPVDIHVPPGYDPATPAPLLVMLHGYGASGAIEEAYLGLTATTDARGMLYVYPDGTENPVGKRFWNATDACCAPEGSTVDDSAYISAVIARAKADYNVDPRRVFIVGHSNGGFMAYRMACDHADDVAAIVSIEAATFADPAECRPSQAVAALEVHGTADDTILYGGGATSAGGAPYPGAVATAEAWARLDGCATTPDDPAPSPRAIVNDLAPATVASYSSGCAPGGHAELWTQPGGVHIPPWNPTFREQIIDFLLAHPMP